MAALNHLRITDLVGIFALVVLAGILLALIRMAWAIHKDEGQR